jgi:hypothetical protein
MISSRIDLTASNNEKLKKDIPLVHNILYGRVISNQDENQMGRLKVKVRGIDDKYNIADADLPYCHSLLPKFFHVIPKENEVVRVLISDINRPFSLRFWLGPVISQPQFYKYENSLTAENGTEYALTIPDKAPNQFENSKGIYPELNDVAVLGRDNNDIILKDKQVTLRVGKHIVNDNLQLNRKNPGYINLKLSDDGNISSIMTVANKIGLMSHDGKRRYKTILDDEEITNFFNTAHPMLKGDLTVEVLKKIINAVLYHVHGGAGSPAVTTNPIIELSRINLDNIISENIRLN